MALFDECVVYISVFQPVLLGVMAGCMHRTPGFLPPGSKVSNEIWQTADGGVAELQNMLFYT